MEDAALLELIKSNEHLQAFANCGYDAGLASAAVEIAPRVPSHHMLTHAELVRLFGIVESGAIAAWFAANQPAASTALETTGIDISQPTIQADFAAVVAAGGMKQEHVDAILALATMQDVISHEQVSRVLSPLRLAKSTDGVARIVKIF